MKTTYFTAVVLLTVLFYMPGKAKGGETQKKLNGGYYLLHEECSDEAQLPILIDFKHTPPEIEDFADRISKTAKNTVAALERMSDKDSAINFDHNPLPQIELDVRDSIKADKQHQLLFGTKDSEFVRALLVSQIEASTYAMHISQVLADQESNSGRAKELRHISTQWLARRTEAYRLLRN